MHAFRDCSGAVRCFCGGNRCSNQEKGLSRRRKNRVVAPGISDGFSRQQMVCGYRLLYRFGRRDKQSRGQSVTAATRITTAITGNASLILGSGCRCRHVCHSVSHFRAAVMLRFLHRGLHLGHRTRSDEKNHNNAYAAKPRHNHKT